MTTPEEPGRRRRRILVPFDLGSSLSAPYGWTNRMRREEGFPERGASAPVRIGFWGNLWIALLGYGPLVVGAVWGAHAWGGWLGAGLGALIALAVQAVVGVVVMVVTGISSWRRSRRH